MSYKVRGMEDSSKNGKTSRTTEGSRHVRCVKTPYLDDTLVQSDAILELWLGF